jgi:hypothetical protein
MTWSKFATSARHLEHQLPSVKRSVLEDTAAPAELDNIRKQIAEVRIQLDDLRRVGIKGPQPIDGSTLSDVRTALDDLRECLETLGPLLAEMRQRTEDGRSRSPRQLQALARERTKTANAVATLEDRLTVLLAHLRSHGIQAYRTRQPEVRATVSEHEPPNHRKLA